MKTFPKISQLPETPSDAQLKAVAGHIISLNSPKFDGVKVKTLTLEGEDIIGTFASDGDSYEFVIEDLGDGDFDLTFSPSSKAVNFSGGEIADYIEFVNAKPIVNTGDILTPKLLAEVQPEINEMIFTIGDLLNQSESVELAKEKIAGLYGQLKSSTLEKQFSLYSQAATLAGAYDAQTETDEVEFEQLQQEAIAMGLDLAEYIAFHKPDLAHDVAILFEAENPNIEFSLPLEYDEYIEFKYEKKKEGSTKIGKNGETLVLTNSRWRKQTKAEAAASGGNAPKAADGGDKPIPTSKELLKNKKADLVGAAEALGIDPKGKTKAVLADEIIAKTQEVKGQKDVPEVKVEPKKVDKPKPEGKTNNSNEVLSTDPKKAKDLGRGAFGEVYLTDKGTAYKKHSPRDDGFFGSIEDYQKIKKDGIRPEEIEATKKLGDLGISPKLLGVRKEGDAITGYEMEFLGDHKILGDAPSIGDKNASLKAIAKMHLAGILHNDLHGGNLMVKGDSAKMIDLGSSSKFNAKNPSDDDLFRWQKEVGKFGLTSIKDDYPDTKIGNLYKSTINEFRKSAGKKVDIDNLRKIYDKHYATLTGTSKT